MPDPSPTRVFVCDDTAEFRALLRVLLEGEGMDVVGEAADGEAGTEGVADLQPDVVVLDLSMPRRDGLRALPDMLRQAPGARVVVVSGQSRSLAAERCRSLGATEYVQKGSPIGDILAAVRAAAVPA